MFRPSAVAALLSLAISTLTARAFACGPAGVFSGVRVAPSDGSVVPKNVPAVYAFIPYSYSGCSVGTVSLTQAPSTAIPLTPDVAAEPGVYFLPSELELGAEYIFGVEFSPGCTYPTPAPVSFEAGASQPLPTQTGKLEVIASGTGSVSWQEFSCGFSTRAAWVRLRLRPACDLVPFLPVTRFEAKANGKHWSSSGVGTTAHDIVVSTTVDLIYAACDGGEGPGATLSPGPVDISIRAHVIGSPSDDPAPAVIHVALHCDGDADTPPPNQPAGGLVDLDHACFSGADVPDLQAGGGCTYVSRRPSSPLLLVWLTVVGVIAVRRRR